MKYRSCQILLLFLFFLSVKGFSQSAPERIENSLRIMSYNIRNAIGMDNIANYDRLCGVIENWSPDIIALQEIDSVTGRSEQVDVLKEIAERTLMHRLYAPAIDFDGGKYGIGILSKEKPLHSFFYPLPGREEERVLLIAEFTKYIFACTHLSLTEEDRMTSLEMIIKEADKANKPFILAGDLNVIPTSSFMMEFQHYFDLLTNSDIPTFPADIPTECLDYIAVYRTTSPSYTLLENYVPQENMASDHRPVVADIRFITPKEQIFKTRPYLQNPIKNALTIMWQTNVPTYSWVEFGTDTTSLQVVRPIRDGQVLCNNFNHKICLTDLEAGKQYYYRVCSQEITLYKAYNKGFGETAVSPFSTFILPDSQTTDFTALIFNDLHKQVPTLKALYEQVKDIPYDMVFFNGDCIDDPATEAMAIDHMSIQCETVGADRVPVFYLRGNHEIRGAYSIGLRDLFDYVGDKTYGSFSWGDTRFVMLDCGEDKPDDHIEYSGLNDFTQLRLDQVTFLEEELKSKAFRKAKKRILLNHIPLYGNSDTYQPCPELWGNLLSNASFHVNISGHTHRFAYHPTNSIGNNFPVVIGGSQRVDTATVMVLKKKGNDLSLQVINTKGEKLLDLKL